MNVGQLITELQKLDPKLHVLMFDADTCQHEELYEVVWGEGCNSVVLETDLGKKLK